MAEFITLQRTQGYHPTEGQRVYAYRLACNILGIQKPHPHMKYGYSEDQARDLVQHYTIDQLQEALVQVQTGNDVKFR